MHYVKIITLLVPRKNIIDAVNTKVNLNEIGSLQRKMTLIDDGHIRIWAWHDMALSWHDRPSGIWPSVVCCKLPQCTNVQMLLKQGHFLVETEIKN